MYACDDCDIFCKWNKAVIINIRSLLTFVTNISLGKNCSPVITNRELITLLHKCKKWASEFIL